MAADLKKMTEKQLLKLKSDIDKQLEVLSSNKLVEARKAAEEAAKSFGVELDDILSMPAKPRRASKAKGKKVPAKYKNPANAKETWTGRGRKPLWVVAALDSGKSLEDLKI